MEFIKRRIKIFWLDHRDPILFYSIVIASIIIIVQFLNQIAIQKEKEEKNSYISTEVEKYKTYSIEDQKLVESFINYCKETKIEDVYALLSNKCKEDLYPTINDFQKKYYNNIFNVKRTVRIEYDYEKDLYKITFYRDLLETGKLTDATNIVDYYKIEEEVIESKIYINYYKNIK